MTTTYDAAAAAETRTVTTVLVALSLCHFLNDTVQSLLPAIYPLLQANYQLSFTEIGLLGAAFQVTASLLQPAVGLYTDRRPLFRLASLGMGASLLGLVLLGSAGNYGLLLIAAMCVGLGSAIFHPDSSRVTRAAAGTRYGFAQSLFQTGGNAGSALGPLLAAYVVLPFGQPSIAWFCVLALLAMAILWNTGGWARENHRRTLARKGPPPLTALPRRRVIFLLAVLGIISFSKHLYLTSLSSYYTFFAIERFDVSIAHSQIMLFLFLGAAAAGTYLGGPIGDRYGRRFVIWVSILGVLPFSLALPFANYEWTIVLTMLIGFTMASAFSAIIVYAQALVPGRVGLVSGLFFGFAFGVGGIAAAGLGVLADFTSIGFVYGVCSVLPALGLLTAFLPPERDLRA